MSRRYLAPSALLPSGWADNVLIVVGDDGAIDAVKPNQTDADAEHLGGPATPGQRRFITDTDSFSRMLDALAGSLRESPLQRLGVAPHSLRAVAPEELRRVLGHGDSLDLAMPFHIHAAEQQKEVDDCLAWSG